MTPALLRLTGRAAFWPSASVFCRRAERRAAFGNISATSCDRRPLPSGLPRWSCCAVRSAWGCAWADVQGHRRSFAQIAAAFADWMYSKTLSCRGNWADYRPSGLGDDWEHARQAAKRSNHWAAGLLLERGRSPQPDATAGQPLLLPYCDPVAKPKNPLAGLLRAAQKELGFVGKSLRKAQRALRRRESTNEGGTEYVTRLDVVLKSDPFDAAEPGTLGPKSKRGCERKCPTRRWTGPSVYGVTVHSRDMARMMENDRTAREPSGAGRRLSDSVVCGAQAVAGAVSAGDGLTELLRDARHDDAVRDGWCGKPLCRSNGGCRSFCSRSWWRLARITTF